MDYLLLDQHQVQASAELSTAVLAAGLEVERRDVYLDCPETINAWGIAQVPCLVRVIGDRAVYQVTDPARVATFLEDAAP
jgi:hypothetical protein